LINIVESNAMPYGYIETTNETTDVRIWKHFVYFCFYQNLSRWYYVLSIS
jgi:hypothetical protein